VIEKKSDQQLVSRRDFLVAGGAVIAAGALTACTPKSTAAKPLSEVNPADQFKVVWPLGEWAGKVISLAPRLATLSGKTVGLPGGGSAGGAQEGSGGGRDSTYWNTMKQLLTAKYPDIKFVTSGWPSVSGSTPEPDAWAKAYKDLKVDAVITAVGV